MFGKGRFDTFRKDQVFFFFRTRRERKKKAPNIKSSQISRLKLILEGNIAILYLFCETLVLPNLPSGGQATRHPKNYKNFIYIIRYQDEQLIYR